MSVGFASPNFGAHIRYLLGYGFWLENNGEMVSMDRTIQGWPSYGKDDIVGSGCLLSSSFGPATEEKSSSNNSDENAQQIQYIMLPFYTLNGQLCGMFLGTEGTLIVCITQKYIANCFLFWSLQKTHFFLRLQVRLSIIYALLVPGDFMPN
jgi:hypothetical protein